MIDIINVAMTVVMNVCVRDDLTSDVLIDYCAMSDR